MEIRLSIALVMVASLASGNTALGSSSGEGREISERRFVVLLDGRVNGEVRAVVRGRAEGGRVHELRSALRSPRDPGQVRRLEEMVISLDGRFLSGESRLEMGNERRVVLARIVRGAVEVTTDGAPPRRIEVPAGEIVWAQMEAVRHLALMGAEGDSLLTFDPGSGLLGRIRLLKRPTGGSVVLDELGVTVRYLWEGDELLPKEIHIDGLKLSYLIPQDARRAPAPSIAQGSPSHGAVVLEGRPLPGSRVRVEPPGAFPGLDCEGGIGRISRSGPICPVDDAPTSSSAPQPGPQVRALAGELPSGLAPEEKARWLAERIAERLSGSLFGAGLWEAGPEQALEQGVGDCNEAAAVFMAVAPLIGLEAGRRTGLIADEAADRGLLWPHAWVEVRLGAAWTRIDPVRGEAPAKGIYVDLGDGSTLSARMRTLTAATMGARVVVQSE